MRLFRVLLIAAFMLAAFTTTTAQASTNQTGFVPLLRSVNPNASMRAQVHDVMQRLTPRLEQAQRAGKIIYFEPSYASGVLKMVYRSDLNTAALFGNTPVFDSMGKAAAIVGAPVRVPSQPAGTPGVTAGPPLFVMYLYGSSFDAYGLTASAHVIGKLKTGAGVLVAVFDGYADGSGNLSGYFSWDGPFSDIMPGYTVIFKEYVGGVLQNTYSVMAPGIKFTGVDKAASVASGKSRPNSPYTIHWWRERWGATVTSTIITMTGTTSATGTWSKDLGTIPMLGGDELTFLVSAGSNFRFMHDTDVPYMHCELNGNYCCLHGFPLKPATIAITTGGVTYTLNQSLSESGYRSVYVVGPSGNPIFLPPGTTVSGTDVPLWTFPNITAGVNYTTDVVSGKLPANKRFFVSVHQPYWGWQHQQYLMGSASGTYSADFTAQINLLATEPLGVYIEYKNPSTGNFIDFYKAFAP